MKGNKRVKRRKIPTQTKTFSFDKFVSWPRAGDGDKNALYAVDSRNCDCMDGSMKNGVTTRVHRTASGLTAKYPVDVADMDKFFYTYTLDVGGNYNPTLCFLTKLGEYYYLYNTNTVFSKLGHIYMGDACEISPYFDTDQEMYMVLFGEDGVMMLQESLYEQSDYIDHFKGGCVLDDRAYGVVQQNMLVYSAPLDILNFDSNMHDSGKLFIQCDMGKTVSLRSLDKRLYLFYEYGIVEIEPAGSATNFKMRKMSYAGGKIMRGCVGECMGKLYFFALDGVYALDHNGVEKKFEKLQLRGKDVNDKGSFAAFNGGFFLRYYDYSGVWTTVYLDGALDSGYKTMDMPAISDLGGTAIFAGGTMLQFVVTDGSLPLGEKSFFLTETLTFGTEEAKLLKNIRLMGSGSAVVRVFDGKNWQTSPAKFSNGMAQLEINAYGQDFQVEIILNQQSLISACEMEVEFVRRA